MTEEVSRSALGRRSRRKGPAFELVVRDHILEALVSRNTTDGLTIRRSSQAERAWDADLIIEGPPPVPQWLLDIWVECEHANDPNPAAKMVQAKRDAGAATLRLKRQRTPVVVWRRTGERTIWLSTELQFMLELLHAGNDLPPVPGHGTGLLVTCRLGEFLDAIARRL